MHEMIRMRMIHLNNGKCDISSDLCRDIIRNLVKNSKLRLAILDSVWSRYRYRRRDFDSVFTIAGFLEYVIMND